MGSLFVHKLKPKERFGLNLVFDRKVTGFTYARHLKTACFDGFSIFVRMCEMWFDEHLDITNCYSSLFLQSKSFGCVE